MWEVVVEIGGLHRLAAEATGKEVQNHGQDNTEQDHGCQGHVHLHPAPVEEEIARQLPQERQVSSQGQEQTYREDGSPKHEERSADVWYAHHSSLACSVLGASFRCS